MPENPATIASLYRYPVKGLTPEHLTSVTLAPGQTLAVVEQDFQYMQRRELLMALAHGQ